MDIKEIRQRREDLQKDIAAKIEEFERLTTLTVVEIRLRKMQLGNLVDSKGFRTEYRVDLDTPI